MMELGISKGTTETGNRRTFVSLVLKRTAGALLGAIVGRSFLRPKKLIAATLHGRQYYKDGRLVCDCTSPDTQCGCVNQ